MKPKQSKAKKPHGRPLTYDPAVADRICKELADGASLRKVCSAPGMPPESTVRGWVVDDVQGFAAQYTRARQLLAERWADEVLDLADLPPSTLSDGRIDTGAVNHQRLMVDSRKWLLSKVLPKVYGDKVAVDHAGGVSIVLKTNVPDAEDGH
jgi:hypothetical protein